MPIDRKDGQKQTTVCYDEGEERIEDAIRRTIAMVIVEEVRSTSTDESAMGAVNDKRTKILLDTGANISTISDSFAKKLQLRRLTIIDKQIVVQRIGKSKVVTTSRTNSEDQYRVRSSLRI